MKLKYGLIAKLNTLSAKEMDLLLYVIQHADEATSLTEGVHYAEAMKYTGMCKQSFYNALRGLQQKGVIIAVKGSDVDYNITVPGNAFPGKDAYHEGYINLNRKAFREFHFRRLKAHEKYMLFEFLKLTHKDRGSYREEKERFYDRLTRELKVTRRVIRGYLHTLKRFFSIGIKDGLFYVTYKATVFEARYKKRSEEKQHFDFLIRKECHREHIRYENHQIQDTADLVSQYRDQVKKTQDIVQILMSCIGQSIQGEKKKDRELRPKYIHLLLREKLQSDKIQNTLA